MPLFPFKFYHQNLQGRDFVVGDLHGMFSLLESQLDKLDFNPENDRVFSVGDLIDRGPESYRVLEFLDKPWFHTIKGNHEMMLIKAKNKNTTYKNWINNHGGEWWEDIDQTTQNNIRERLESLPITMEVACNIGKVGIVHADIPVGITWQKLVHRIHIDNEICDYLMWSRNRYKYIQLTGETEKVEGIDLVVMGHTPITKAFKISNLYYIDTGASYLQKEGLGRLTILQIHPTLKSYEYPESLDRF